MAFKSKAQKTRLGELVASGKFSKDIYDSWDSKTDTEKLPERVERKAKEAKIKADAYKKSVSNNQKKSAVKSPDGGSHATLRGKFI